VLLIYSYTFKYYLLYILLLIYGKQGVHPGGHSFPRYSEHPAPQSQNIVSIGGVVVVVGASVVDVLVVVDVGGNVVVDVDVEVLVVVGAAVVEVLVVVVLVYVIVAEPPA
jgi:hypothetical protein